MQTDLMLEEKVLYDVWYVWISGRTIFKIIEMS